MYKVAGQERSPTRMWDTEGLQHGLYLLLQGRFLDTLVLCPAQRFLHKDPDSWDECQMLKSIIFG